MPEQSDIVSAKSKNGQEVVYRSTATPIRPPNMKLAVLVNKGSASASEIVSGAVQDLDAGVIVGPSTTYGKGLVQVPPSHTTPCKRFTLNHIHDRKSFLFRTTPHSSTPSRGTTRLRDDAFKRSSTPADAMTRQSSPPPLPLPPPPRTISLSLLHLSRLLHNLKGVLRK